MPRLGEIPVRRQGPAVIQLTRLPRHVAEIRARGRRFILGDPHGSIEPSAKPVRPGDRIKTDRRDALLLARAARAGELVSVMIPDERDEALRDCRKDWLRGRPVTSRLLVLHTDC